MRTTTVPDCCYSIMAFLSAILACTSVASAQAQQRSFAPNDFPEFNRHPAKARVITEDLERFWAAWDLAEANPEERRAIFQNHYLDAGSPGLQAFLKLRIRDVDRLLANIDAHPQYYGSLRALMPEARAAAEPVHSALYRLQELLPGAVFPDTYLLIGSMNSGGTFHLDGLLIGVEMYGLTAHTPTEELGDWHRAVIGSMDNLPAIIVHELVHFQQLEFARTRFETLLGQSIYEGAADFLAELVVGQHINQHIHEWALPRETELWEQFREAMHGKDSSDWLYNGGTVSDRPADLGYFIGYRIVRAYYERAEDKPAAIRDVVAMTDPEAFLRASGYAP